MLPSLDGFESQVIDTPPEPSQLRQLILPTDRRNPCISLYRMTDRDGRRIIQVYYGLELLEEVADDFQDPTWRSMVARLYNAKLKLKSLTEVFQIDPKTIRSWGEALKSRDPQRMSVMFFGADAGRKRTALVESFVRVRLPELLKQRIRNYRATLQAEIASIFDIRLSGETLRILIAGIKPPVLPADHADEPAADHAADHADEPASEPADEPNDEPADEPASQPASEPASNPVDPSMEPNHDSAETTRTWPEVLPGVEVVPTQPSRPPVKESPDASGKPTPFFSS